MFNKRPFWALFIFFSEAKYPLKIIAVQIFLLLLHRKHTSSPRRLMIQCEMNTTCKGKLLRAANSEHNAVNNLKLRTKSLVSGSQENIVTP